MRLSTKPVPSLPCVCLVSVLLLELVCAEVNGVFQHRKRDGAFSDMIQRSYRRETSHDDSHNPRQWRKRENDANVNANTVAPSFQPASSAVTAGSVVSDEKVVDNGNHSGNVTDGKSLLQIYEEMKQFKEWMKEPYVHGLILPAVIGVLAALTTVCCLCCINSCVKRSARNKRRRRIRGLAEDLKNDKKTLLSTESDDEF